MKTPSRIRLQTQVLTVTDGFDHLIFWFDRPELPFDKELLKPHCGDLNRIECQPKFHANRKLSLSLLQPTQKCLILLRELVGWKMVVDVTYAEVARDILVRNTTAATEHLNHPGEQPLGADTHVHEGSRQSFVRLAPLTLLDS